MENGCEESSWEGDRKTYVLFMSCCIRDRRNIALRPILWMDSRRNEAERVILRVDGGVEFEKIDEVFAGTFTREQLQAGDDHHNKCVRANTTVENIAEVA